MLPTPRERAKKSNRLLLSAIRSFYDVQRDHPDQFLAGYNALLLMAVAEGLFPGIQLPTPLFNRAEFATVMHYLASAGRQTAEKTGDYDMQFWCAVALAGLELLKDSKEGTLRAVKDACAVPSATRFYLQLLQERIEFLRRLEFKPKIMKAAAELVKENLHPRPLRKPWGKVAVYYGYPCDPSAGPKGRFPRSAVKAVHRHMNEILKKWKIGKCDLAICAGVSEGDIIFAERCLELGAFVRLLILERTADELAAALGDPLSREWASRSASLLDHPKTEAWYHRTELGEPVDSAYLKARHNWWIFNTARMEAQNAPEDAADDARFYGLILSDGSPKVTGPEEPAFFAPLILASNNHQGRVEEIDLRHLES